MPDQNNPMETALRNIRRLVLAEYGKHPDPLLMARIRDELKTLVTRSKQEN